MKTDDFDYYLPEELIAQVPLEHREESKLLVLDKDTGEIIDQVRVPVADTDNVEVVYDKLMMLGGDLVLKTVDAILEGNVKTTPQEELVKVDECNKENKNFVLKITDQRLLSMTGGIVQGMSGSTILQNGKLIGAVTHVFLNDPTRGYGIGIEKMFGT